MRRLSTAIRVALFSLLLPSALRAGALDDYYLARFAPPVKSAQLSAATTETATAAHRHGDHCRTMLLLRLKKDWNQLQPETQQILATQLAKPVLAAQRSFTSEHFVIYYATSGTDAPLLTDSDGDGAPNYVEQVAGTFEEVYRAEVTQMGYRAPYMNSRYAVYLRDLAAEGVYGYTYSESTIVSGTNGVTSYIEIDKAFDPSVYGGNAIDNLRVTAAHEFHHAIQFGYNPSFEMWYGEATATWIEDEVYDNANQLYWYLDNYLGSTNSVSLNADLGNNTEYGRWIFNRFLAERHSPLLIREIWEDLGGRKSPADWSEIPAIPVIDVALGKRGTSVAKELSSFAGTLYRGDWSTHVDDREQIPQVAPLGSFSSYPATSATLPSTGLMLPKYAFAYYRFFPSTTSPSYLKLDLAGLSANATAVAYRKGNDGAITSYARDPQTGAISIPSFTVGQASEVMLAISSNGATGGVTYAFSAGETVPPQRALSVAFAGSGGGTVNGGITCASGASCQPVQYMDNSHVTLYATPDSNSLFGGWSAPCTVSGNRCDVTLSSDLTVSPTFIASPPARVAGTGYSQISSAYAGAADGATIQARELTFAAPLVLNRPIAVKIEGGYDAGFSTSQGFSTLEGGLRISSGTVKVEKVLVR